MLYAGVDIGSTTSKCVIVDEAENMLSYTKSMTEFNRNVSGNKVLDAALAQIGKTDGDVARVVSTGYGRKAFQRADKDIPEIIAHTLGTVHLMPGARTIIDIGGQDSKVIGIDERGTISKFEMNDKCAAGTGRFFEVLTHRLLGIEMDELESLIFRSKNPVTVSSTCTIFAETEIISLLSQNIPIEDIAAGTGYSIAKRIVGLGKSGRIPFDEPIFFSGGVANNKAIAAIFSEILGKQVTAIGNPQSTAALGAALTAKRDGAA